MRCTTKGCVPWCSPDKCEYYDEQSETCAEMCGDCQVCENRSCRGCSQVCEECVSGECKQTCWSCMHCSNDVCIDGCKHCETCNTDGCSSYYPPWNGSRFECGAVCCFQTYQCCAYGGGKIIAAILFTVAVARQGAKFRSRC
ncbi:hypothetical protein M2351_005419 [Azospirillum canadense]|nr:hypothetical protein [Azospirillum canadense]